MTKLSTQFAALSREDYGHRTMLALAAGNMGTFEWNLETDGVECDEVLRGLFGLPKGSILGQQVLETIHPDDLDGLQAVMKATLEHDEDYDTSFRVIRQDGSSIWVGGRGRVVERTVDGRAARMLGVNWDMSQAKDQEERLTHLVREMNHRVNNAFALMESMLVLGVDFSHDVESFSDMMCTQIHALADAHQLAADFFLHRSINAETVPLNTVFDKVLRVWLLGPLADRIDVQIPDGLCIRSKDITPLSMILYELATNAVKYSVLGAKVGRLSVRISCAPDQMARLDWIETLAPEDVEQRKVGLMAQNTGLGTLLLTHCLEKMSAKVLERTIDKDGMRFSLSFRIGPTDSETCEVGCEDCGFNQQSSDCP